ncbi:Hypothetical_protein [Hexamita inflata]|uniref:Hypothetical_protein n=1 Tax=Hexamita inflata TaxID=28002 RepID=A0AA86RFX9_9EUKA|nr:Hypothetical protein HINF_LOCUS27393 [Hexamita inflata]CAI9972182.1 Hypothetical protein HINF_LOCUS59827 [Hexamita inflata]
MIIILPSLLTSIYVSFKTPTGTCVQCLDCMDVTLELEGFFNILASEPFYDNDSNCAVYPFDSDKIEMDADVYVHSTDLTNIYRTEFNEYKYKITDMDTDISINLLYLYPLYYSVNVQYQHGNEQITLANIKVNLKSLENELNVISETDITGNVIFYYTDVNQFMMGMQYLITVSDETTTFKTLQTVQKPIGARSDLTLQLELNEQEEQKHKSKPIFGVMIGFVCAIVLISIIFIVLYAFKGKQGYQMAMQQ